MEREGESRRERREIGERKERGGLRDRVRGRSRKGDKDVRREKAEEAFTGASWRHWHSPSLEGFRFRTLDRDLSPLPLLVALGRSQTWGGSSFPEFLHGQLATLLQKVWIGAGVRNYSLWEL